MFFSSIRPVVGKDKAPDFTLVDIEGNEFSLATQLDKVVLINFFAIDCSYCRLEMSHLRNLYNEYSSDHFIIISISVSPWDTNNDLGNFAQQYHMEWTVARDTDNVANEYGVSPIPHTIIVDAEGYKRYDHIGLTPETTFRSEINSLLGVENGDSSIVPSGLSNVLIATAVGVIAASLIIGTVALGRKFKWLRSSKKPEDPSG